MSTGNLQTSLRVRIRPNDSTNAAFMRQDKDASNKAK